MRTIEEILSEIENILEREKQFFEDFGKNGGPNTPASGAYIGAVDVLKELKDFILDR